MYFLSYLFHACTAPDEKEETNLCTFPILHIHYTYIWGIYEYACEWAYMCSPVCGQIGQVQDCWHKSYLIKDQIIQWAYTSTELFVRENNPPVYCFDFLSFWMRKRFSGIDEVSKRDREVQRGIFLDALTVSFSLFGFLSLSLPLSLSFSLYFALSLALAHSLHLFISSSLFHWLHLSLTLSFSAISVVCALHSHGPLTLHTVLAQSLLSAMHYSTVYNSYKWLVSNASISLLCIQYSCFTRNIREDCS